MRHIAFIAALLAMPVLMTAPVDASESSTGTEAADIQQIIDWGTKWKRHFEAGETEKLRDMYEPDAVLMAHGTAPQIGVDAILTFLGRNTSAGNRVTIDFADEEIKIEGDTGYLIAKYWMTIAPPNASAIEFMGRSFLVYKKGKDGRWRLWRDMDNQAPDIRAEARPSR